MTGGIASINVGPNETPFDVHLELICDCSTYFNALFESRFTQPTTQPVFLPDDDPDTFAEFLQWAYRGKIFEDAAPVTWLQLCELWVLAGKLGAPKLQNLVMEHCRRKYDEHDRHTAKRWDVVEFVYRKTAIGSPLRKMMVDLWRVDMDKVSFEFVKGDVPRLFLEDLCLAFLECREPDWRIDFGRYLVEESRRNLSTRLGPSKDDGLSSIPQMASPQQMARRKVKPAKFRRRPGQTPSPSLGINTPPSGASVQGDDLARQVENLTL